jgi:putative proteasome-type protease
VIINSGNLAVTQATINHLEQAIRRGVEPNLLSVYSMYDVAELVGTWRCAKCATATAPS